MLRSSSSFALFFAGSLLVACGGRVPPEEIGGADTGVGPADTSSDAIGSDGELPSETGPSPTDAAPDSPPPTAETCKKFVAGFCNAKAQACCGTAVVTWSADGCNTALDYYCNALIDQVTLGRMTYDESYLDACVAGWDANLSACEVDSLTSARNQIPCTHLFNGRKEPGETCSGVGAVECKAPPGFGAYCDVPAGSKTGKCRAYGVVEKDQPCNYYGSTVRYCGSGLYCDLTSPSATCKTAKTVGESCDGADDLSCGLTNRCVAGKCAARLAEGATCSVNDECASFQCTGGKCGKSTAPVVSAFICNGG